MDYIDLPPSFIYKAKTDISDFPISVDQSLEREFFNLLKRRPFIHESEDAPQYVLAIYNNACYICRLIVLEKNPTLYLKKYMKIASDNHKDILWGNHMLPATMALVYNWIRTELFKSAQSFYSGIHEEERKEFIEDVLNTFQDWDLKGASIGKEDFYGLIIDTNLHKTHMGDCDFDMRDIKEIIESPDAYPIDIVKGIDYILDLISDGLYDTKAESICYLLRMQYFYENKIYVGLDHNSNRALMKIKELIKQLEAKPSKEEKPELSFLTPLDYAQTDDTYPQDSQMGEKDIEKEKIEIADSNYDEETETLYLNNNSNNTNKGSKKKRTGRPKAKPFEEYIKKDAPEGFMHVLVEMMEGKKGKDAALIIKACTGYWIDSPENKSVVDRFPSVKSTSYNNAMGNPTLFSSEQIDNVRKEFELKLKRK